MPGTGHLAQYAHPLLLSLTFEIEREWQSMDDRKFGIGKISLAEGHKYEHATHQQGIEIDIRAVCKDMMTGPAARHSRFDKEYDRAGTIKYSACFCNTRWRARSSSTEMERMDMNLRLPCCISVLGALPLLALADEAKDEGRYLATPLKGDYYMYGGTLAEMTRTQKVSFMFRGPLAKDPVGRIGPSRPMWGRCRK